MNFKKLPKQKRDHLILVAVITVALLAGLGFGLIRRQYDALKATRAKAVEAEERLEKMKVTIEREPEIQKELIEIEGKLSVREANMAAGGDPYAWALDLIRSFRNSYRVDVPSVGQPIQGDSSLLPRFPYRQATFTVSGSGYYHDIGRFVADFENKYPEIRIVNLTVAPLSGTVAEDKEKLEFRMDVIALTRPNPS
jgi:Tfp pilus assembly protein PilO